MMRRSSSTAPSTIPTITGTESAVSTNLATDVVCLPRPVDVTFMDEPDEPDELDELDELDEEPPRVPPLRGAMMTEAAMTSDTERGRAMNQTSFECGNRQVNRNKRGR